MTVVAADVHAPYPIARHYGPVERTVTKDARSHSSHTTKAGKAPTCVSESQSISRANVLVSLSISACAERRNLKGASMMWHGAPTRSWRTRAICGLLRQSKLSAALPESMGGHNTPPCLPRLIFSLKVFFHMETYFHTALSFSYLPMRYAWTIFLHAGIPNIHNCRHV